MGKNALLKKEVLGKNLLQNKNILKNIFMKASTSDTKYSCTYCNQDGHTSFLCFVKKNAYFGGKLAWVLKESRTNIQGPKLVWVPKVKIWFLFISIK